METLKGLIEPFSWNSAHLTLFIFILKAYVDMRKIGSGRGMVSAYPRQLESLIRLAEAHAKVRFSEKVETIDVEEAKRLHREALKQSATDPRTGFVDISILTTGAQDGALCCLLESISRGTDGILQLFVGCHTQVRLVGRL